MTSAQSSRPVIGSSPKELNSSRLTRVSLIDAFASHYRIGLDHFHKCFEPFPLESFYSRPKLSK